MDYLSLKAAVTEAGKRFAGRKIGHTRQISTLEIILRFHREATLLLSIDSARPGLFIVDPDVPYPDMRTPFSDLLNARISGTTMKSLHLPEAGERVVFLDFEVGWPTKPGNPHRIILEVMGQHSNLEVVHDGMILLPLKTVSKSKSRLRPVLPGERWRPPPLQPGTAIEKITPDDLPSPSLPEAVKDLLQTVRGLSPYAAGQAVLKAAKGDRQALYQALTSMILSTDGENGFLHRTGNRYHLAPFEPFTVPHDEACRRFAPFSSAAGIWREEGQQAQTTVKNEEEQLADGLRKMESRLRLALKTLEQETERCRTHQQVRIMAETLLIHASELRQGLQSVVLPNPYETEKELTIPLDPSMSALENADMMFADAHRLKRGITEISERSKKIEEELSTVHRSLEDLLEKGDPASAKTLLDKDSGGRSGKKSGTFRAYTGPGKKFTAEGFTILVGRSALDNERVTFEAAGPNDLWFHARDYPGSHVVLLTGKRKVPDSVLYRAAELAAKESGARDEKAPEIMVTERKWVRKLKGNKPGKVTVERYRTLTPKKKQSRIQR